MPLTELEMVQDRREKKAYLALADSDNRSVLERMAIGVLKAESNPKAPDHLLKEKDAKRIGRRSLRKGRLPVFSFGQRSSEITQLADHLTTVARTHATTDPEVKKGLIEELYRHGENPAARSGELPFVSAAHVLHEAIKIKVGPIQSTPEANTRRPHRRRLRLRTAH